MSGPRELRALLESAGIAPKKRWGQNFLVNAEALGRIARLVEAAPGDRVWEIGGGTGALTSILAAAAGSLVVFEIDHGLVRLLEGLLRDSAGAKVVPGDFVRTFGEVVERDGPPHRIVGNLPYRSASRIIAAIAGAPFEARRLVFTVQRELAERMLARPSTKAYSSFSVLCQARFAIRAGGDLGPASFYPQPRVASRIVLLEPRAGSPVAAELAGLERITRFLFATRRKTMRRSLAADRVPEGARRAVTEGLARLGIGTERRAEEMGVEQFIALAGLVGESARELPGPAGGEEIPEEEPGSEDPVLPED
jgi:16S rRNA (adenine1518-N6/adenine1519-N6)-dimethyltransferase